MIPLTRRGHSGATKQNFLWKSGSIYVMDNHRAAMWCWLQEIDPNSSHCLIHIDKHRDTLQANLPKIILNLPKLNGALEDYLDKKMDFNGVAAPVIRWDNYLSIYLDQHGSNIDVCRFLTHGIGDKPNWDGVFENEIWELPENLGYWLETANSPWIVNIDLDYFFCTFEEDESPQLMISEAYIRSISRALREAMDNQRIGVLTICLSPECTSGWEQSEKLATTICEILGHRFSPPPF